MIARNVEQQAGGRWAVWYGHATRRFWAVPRGKYWDGHIEATNALELLARIGEVEAWFGASGGTAGRHRAEAAPARTPVGSWGPA
ncbi:hypothetical protein [Thermomonospora cellulosilytica]|uniref:Uncharacterized protein n=1 Tax=Thermomonospora cellulosilytica TaxID=1411118 RepID=A0A7W3R6X7_9ACTN|nr:hypothetical protein [Thermomonospora cellulosilytica]MBA9001996.1 hypothetical protein [Thermomonospora cellulosilytica]